MRFWIVMAWSSDVRYAVIVSREHLFGGHICPTDRSGHGVHFYCRGNNRFITTVKTRGKHRFATLQAFDQCFRQGLIYPKEARLEWRPCDGSWRCKDFSVQLIGGSDCVPFD